MNTGPIPPETNPDLSSTARLDLRLLVLLAGIKLLIHALTAGQYGYFRDELYFLDLGRHLDWGYVDCAPLIGLYARAALLLGGSLPVLRLLPALAGAGMVALTMLIARQLGGGRCAQGLAGLCVIAAPIYLGSDSVLSMNAFEPLFWMGCVYALIRIVQTGDGRWWVLFGALAGLGLQNKHSTLFFGFAAGIALLLSPQRREFRRWYFWLGGGIALLLFLPNLLWQAGHGFPTLEDLQNVSRSGKNVVLGPLAFIGQQILILHPLLLPVWLGGLAWLLAGKGRRYRVLGWLYLVLLTAMFALKAKNYYLAPVYPMLFAAGAVAVEGWLAKRAWSRGRLWPKAALAAIIVLVSIPIVPLVLPVLPPAKLLAYMDFLGISPPRTEVRHEGPLQQHLSDQFGWPELVADVARIYNSLPPEERARTAIFASNYGEAGAINLFGPARGLPPAICAHQNHYFWGPPDFTGDTFIWLQWDRASLEELFRSVEEAGVHHHPWGMAEENRPIYVCRGLRRPLPVIWPELKHWN